VNEVRRCDEMERKLRFVEKEIKKDEIPMLVRFKNKKKFCICKNALAYVCTLYIADVVGLLRSVYMNNVFQSV
jgi:hypothetical protein